MTKIYLRTVFTVILFLLYYNSVFSQNINHWEMVVAADDTWHYFPGDLEPPANWASPDFDPSSWLSGPGGIGYGDHDDRTEISPVTSVYIRTNFKLQDTSNISRAILHVDYDDAFVAYLNGYEIARANIGTVGIRPTYKTLAAVKHEARKYSGGIAERFVIHKDTISKYLSENDNVLALQIHNFDETSSDLSSATYLSVGIKDTSHIYREVPVWFNDPINEKSNLPLLVIETLGQTMVDESKITAWLKVIDNGPGQMNNYLEEQSDYEGNIGIEIRGQSSQMFPKKSFSIELRDAFGNGTDVSLLGMPAQEDWVLYAPYSDKTMLRNALTYLLGSKMGRWQPRYKYCEVYLNGAYNGVYMLIEKIKRDTNRVDINKLKPAEISGDELTGGYIVKVDKIHDLMVNEYFYTMPIYHYNNVSNYAFTYVYPKFDIIVEEQRTYIKNYLTDLESALNSSSFKDPKRGFRKYMDINSFVDFQIINELANNGDGYRLSTFFYKKRDSDGGKLFAGPLWDFNLGYGNIDYLPLNQATNNWLYLRYGPQNYNTMHWWARLMEDDNYNNTFAHRWEELRAGSFKTDSIMAYLTNTIQYLEDAIDRNYVKWPIIGQYIWPNYFVGDTFEKDVDYLRSWIVKRLDWMDANISNSTDEFVSKYEILVFPNPIHGELNIQLSASDIKKMDIEIINLTGEVVFKRVYSPVFNGDHTIKYDVSNLASGSYMLIIKQNEHVIEVQKLLVMDY